MKTSNLNVRMDGAITKFNVVHKINRRGSPLGLTKRKLKLIGKEITNVTEQQNGSNNEEYIENQFGYENFNNLKIIVSNRSSNDKIRFFLDPKSDEFDYLSNLKDNNNKDKDKSPTSRAYQIRTLQSNDLYLSDDSADYLLSDYDLEIPKAGDNGETKDNHSTSGSDDGTSTLSSMSPPQYSSFMKKYEARRRESMATAATTDSYSSSESSVIDVENTENLEPVKVKDLALTVALSEKITSDSAKCMENAGDSITLCEKCTDNNVSTGKSLSEEVLSSETNNVLEIQNLQRSSMVEVERECVPIATSSSNLSLRVKEITEEGENERGTSKGSTVEELPKEVSLTPDTYTVLLPGIKDEETSVVAVATQFEDQRTVSKGKRRTKERSKEDEMLFKEMSKQIFQLGKKFVRKEKIRKKLEKEISGNRWNEDSINTPDGKSSYADTSIITSNTYWEEELQKMIEGEYQEEAERNESSSDGNKRKVAGRLELEINNIELSNMELEETKKKLQLEQHERQRIKEEVARLREQHVENQTKIDDTEQKIRMEQRECQMLKEEISQMHQYYVEKSSQINTESAAEVEPKSHLNIIEDEPNYLQEQYLETQKKKKDLQQKLQMKQQERQMVKDEVTQLYQNFSENQSKAEDLEEKIQIEQQEREKMKEEIMQLRQLYAESRKTKVQDVEIIKLKSSLNIMKEEVNSYQEEIKRLNLKKESADLFSMLVEGEQEQQTDTVFELSTKTLEAQKLKKLLRTMEETTKRLHSENASNEKLTGIIGSKPESTFNLKGLQKGEDSKNTKKGICERNSAEKGKEQIIIIPYSTSELERCEDDPSSKIEQYKSNKQQYVEKIVALQEEIASVKNQLPTDNTTSSSLKSIKKLFQPVSSSPICVEDIDSTIESKKEDFFINFNKLASAVPSSARSLLTARNSGYRHSESMNMLSTNIKPQFLVRLVNSMDMTTSDNKSRKLLPTLTSTLPSLVNIPPALVYSSATHGTSASVDLLTICTMNYTLFHDEK